MAKIDRIGCTCGQLQLEVQGRPLTSSECYCHSCRAAGSRLALLPGSPPLVREDGGTRFVLYRKDRVRFLSGREHLQEMRLSPDAPTRRVVATCCNTPVFLEFRGGHWLSLYACLWQFDALPPLELRTMTGDLPDPSVLGQEVPHGTWTTLKFYGQLLRAWIAMGFRSPTIELTGGPLALPAPAGGAERARA